MVLSSKEHEEEDCTRFPLVCTNKCGLTEIPREEVRNSFQKTVLRSFLGCNKISSHSAQMEFHLRDHCRMTKVVCPYINAGCVFEVGKSQ